MLASHRIIKIVLTCLLAAAPLCAAPAAQAQEETLKPATAKPLPKLEYKDEHGEVTLVNPRQAKLTIVHFWATWCVPCIAELPEVDALAAKYGPRGLHVITLSVDTNIDKVTAFYADHHLTHLPPYLDNNNMSFLALGLQGLPTTLFVTPDNMEVARTEGPLDWHDPAVIKFIEDVLK